MKNNTNFHKDMSLRITLIASLLYTLAILIYDQKRSKYVSNNIWIPLIWVIILGSRFVSQWLYPGQTMASPDEYLDGSPIDRTIFLLLIAVGAYILSRKKINWSYFIQNNIWITLFFYYCGISIFWSDFPFVAFKRWIKEIGNLIMILIILSEPYPAETIKAILRRCSYIFIPLSIIFIKYLPNIGRFYTRWGTPCYTGVTTSNISLGSLCMIFGVFFFWNFLIIWKKKNELTNKYEIFLNIVPILLILWLLIKADSANAIFSLILGILVLIMLSAIRNYIKYIDIFVFHIILIIVILILIGSYEIIILEMNRDLTLTGRTDIWREVLDMKINPIIGAGYESFWLGDRIKQFWDEYWWRPNQSHNGYLETYLNLGFIGLFLLLMVVHSAYRTCRKELKIDFEFGLFQMSLLVMFIVYNIAEAAFKGLSLIWFLLLLNAIDLIPNSRYKIQNQKITM